MSLHQLCSLDLSLILLFLGSQIVHGFKMKIRQLLVQMMQLIKVLKNHQPVLNKKAIQFQYLAIPPLTFLVVHLIMNLFKMTMHVQFSILMISVEISKMLHHIVSLLTLMNMKMMKWMLKMRKRMMTWTILVLNI